MDQNTQALLDFAASRRIPARISSTLRTCAQQDALWEQGRGAPGPVVTDAHGCQSWHVWGRAVDLVIDGPLSDYKVLGDEWKSWGGVWGGDFPIGDFGHFEWHPGINHVSQICPTGYECPPPMAAWPEDRPIFDRPIPRFFIGLGTAGVLVSFAYFKIWKK
jgi:hypothetical protein